MLKGLKMKRTVTFKLNPKVWNMLESLSNKTGATKTDVLSKAIEAYAEGNISGRNNLLSYAQSLDKNDADMMLADIYAARTNKG